MQPRFHLVVRTALTGATGGPPCRGAGPPQKTRSKLVRDSASPRDPSLSKLSPFFIFLFLFLLSLLLLSADEAGPSNFVQLANLKKKGGINFHPNTSNFLTHRDTRNKKKTKQNKPPPEPAVLMVETAPSSCPCLPEGPTVRHPDVADDEGRFLGGVRVPELPESAPSICGHALLLGRSLSAGARTLPVGGPGVTSIGVRVAFTSR